MSNYKYNEGYYKYKEGLVPAYDHKLLVYVTLVPVKPNVSLKEESDTLNSKG